MTERFVQGKPPAEPVYDVDANGPSASSYRGDEWVVLRGAQIDVRFIASTPTTSLTLEPLGRPAMRLTRNLSSSSGTKLMQNPPDSSSRLQRTERQRPQPSQEAVARPVSSRQFAALRIRLLSRACRGGRLPLLQHLEWARQSVHFDPESKFLAGEDSYILLTVKRGGPMTVEIKSLKTRYSIFVGPERREGKSPMTELSMKWRTC